MNDLEHRVSRALGQIADGVDTPSSGLADDTIRRGRTVQRRRRVAGTVMSVAVIAAAVPLAALAIDDNGGADVIAVQPTTEPSTDATPSTELTPPPRWLMALPAGPQPKVLYAEVDFLVDGEKRIPLPTNRNASPLGRAGDDYVALLTTERSSAVQELVVLSPAGAVTELTSFKPYSYGGAALAADGQRVVWSETRGTDTGLVVASVSGDVLATRTIADYNVGIGAFTPHGIVLTSFASDSDSDAGVVDDHLSLWSGRSGDAPVRLVEDYAFNYSLDGSDQVVVSSEAADYECAALMDLPSGTIHEVPKCTRWAGFSPDGTYYLLDGGDTNAVPHPDIIVRVADGHEVRLPHGDIHPREWEDETHLLAVVNHHDGERPVEYVLRCDATSGDCERTTDALVGGVEFIRD